MKLSLKNKVILTLVLVIGIAIGALWKTAVSNVSNALHRFVLAQINESLNGRLEVGDISLSLSGATTLSKITLVNTANTLIFSCEQISIDFALKDVFGGSVGLDRARTIHMDGAKLLLVRDSNGQWNVNDIIKGKPIAPFSFRGLVLFKNSQLSVAMPSGQRVFENVEGSLDFGNHPDIVLDLKSSTLAVKTSLKDPTDKAIAKGSFTFSSLQLGETTFTNGSGDFTYAADMLNLVNTRASAYGGTVYTVGSVIPKTMRFNQHVTGDNLDSMMLTAQDVQGRVSFSAEVYGQNDWESANADGSFAIPEAVVQGIPVTLLTGDFAKRGSNTRFFNLTAQTAFGQAPLNAIQDGKYIRFKPPELPSVPAPSIPLPSAPTGPTIPGLPSLPKI